jgi:hypothetical protein
MQYKITPAPDNSYIFCKVTGNITAIEALEINMELHSVGKKFKIKKYLIDMTQCQNVDTVFNTYQYAYKDLRNAPIDLSAQTAVLISPEDHSHDFLETVLANSGVNILYFRELEKAEKYLFGDARK